MKPKHGVALGAVVGTLAVSGCCCKQDPETTPVVAKDSEVRLWIRDKLHPYLLLMAKELCAVKNEAAADVGEEELCEAIGEPEGVKPPPPNGNP
jgi:hypothetical protein